MLPVLAMVAGRRGHGGRERAREAVTRPARRARSTSWASARGDDVAETRAAYRGAQASRHDGQPPERRLQRPAVPRGGRVRQRAGPRLHAATRSARTRPRVRSSRSPRASSAEDQHEPVPAGALNADHVQGQGLRHPGVLRRAHAHRGRQRASSSAGVTLSDAQHVEPDEAARDGEEARQVSTERQGDADRLRSEAPPEFFPLWAKGYGVDIISQGRPARRT